MELLPVGTLSEGSNNKKLIILTFLSEKKSF